MLCELFNHPLTFYYAGSITPGVFRRELRRELSLDLARYLLEHQLPECRRYATKSLRIGVGISGMYE
jgi:hypothetical protein